MPCTKQKCRACIFMHLWYFWWSPPLSQENGVDSPLFSPLSGCSLPAALLLVESQAYGQIDISSNCTWLGLSCLAKVLSDQKNQHFSVLCSPFLPSLLKIGDLLFLSPPLFCYIILSNILSVCYLPPIHADTHPDPLQTYKFQVKFTFLQHFYSPLMLFFSVCFFLQTLLFKCFCRLFGTNWPLPKSFPDLNKKQKYEVDQLN